MRFLTTRSKKRAPLFTLLVLILAMLCARPANAQVSGATLTGTVTDPSGATIPQAQIAITNASTGVTRTVSTDSAGFYTAPNLLPGTYEIRATATGFSTQLQKGISLTVGAQQALDIKMQVGQVSQTVEVTTEAPTVELTSSTLSAVVNATTVRELPLNGLPGPISPLSSRGAAPSKPSHPSPPVGTGGTEALGPNWQSQVGAHKRTIIVWMGSASMTIVTGPRAVCSAETWAWMPFRSSLF